MPAVGDTLVRFGRSYIFLNPEDSGGTPISGRVGTYRLSVDDEYDGGGSSGPDTSGTTGTATVDSTEDAVVLNELLYIGANGNAFKAKADDIATSSVVGVALEAKNPGETITYGTNVKINIFDTGVVDNNSTGILAVGATYYLSAANKGKWTTTPDTTTSGAVVIQCGVCNSTNQMLVEIQTPTEI